MILYHGTTLDSANAIEQGINVKINDDGRQLDFGYGFYLGDYRYARRTARDRAYTNALNKNSTDEAKTPVVIKFEFDVSKVKKGCIESYSFKSLKFLRTVFLMRLTGSSKYVQGKVVTAPLADGPVDDVISLYKEGSQLRKALCYFLYWLPMFHRQWVIKDQKIADDCLTILERRVEK